MTGESSAFRDAAMALTIGGEVLPIWFEVLVVLVLGSAMMALAVRLFTREA